MDPLQILRTAQLFSCLSDAEKKKLARASEVKIFDEGRRLVRAGLSHDAVIFLARGKVALYRRNKKRDVTLLLGILEAPSLFGDAECAAGTHWMCTARAEEDSVCLWIPNREFLALIDGNGELAARMYRDASVRHLLANHTAQTLALYDVETRLQRLLLDFGYRFGRQSGGDVIIDRPISKTELAAALGVTRKTITRAFPPLMERGVLSTRDDGTLVLHGLDHLKQQLPADLFGLSSQTGEPVQPVMDRWDAEAVRTEDEDEP